MAKYHEHLKYHEDTVEKKALTKEDLDFLKDLQKELNTQDNLCQADPRYWVIKGTEKVYHVEDADGYELVDSGYDVLADTLEEICKYINENLLEEINENRISEERFTVEYEDGFGLFGSDKIIIKWNSPDYGFEQTEELESLEEIKDWLSEQGYDDYDVVSYKIVDKIYENTMFLTQIDAENHLRANHYHYSDDAHTYAMTAWRNPRVEKLVKLLQETDWNKQIGIEYLSESEEY